MSRNSTRWLLIIGGLFLTLATAGLIRYTAHSSLGIVNLTFFVLGMTLTGLVLWRIIDGISRIVLLSGAFIMFIGILMVFFQGADIVAQILLGIGLIFIFLVVAPNWKKINRIIEGED